MTNRIHVNQLWHDSTGQYCAEIDLNEKRVASVYTQQAEMLLVEALRDPHTLVIRSIRGLPRAA